MSILETNKVDMWGFPKGDPDRIVLGIADHLNWTPEQEGEHLELLQEKINSYVRFIESGELLHVVPQSLGRLPSIRVIGKYALSKQGKRFVEQATIVLRGAGIELEHVLSNPGEQ